MFSVIDGEPMRMLIVGRPGSGKGTQSERLSQVLGIAHLSFGDLLRTAIDERSPLGRCAERYVSEGRLVPEPLVVQLMDDRVARSDVRHRGFILDGFPRTLGQLDALLQHLTPDGVDVSIELAVAPDVALARLESRGRSDDVRSVIRQRLDEYERETEPMIASLARAGLLITVDANHPAGEVTAEVLRSLRRSRPVGGRFGNPQAPRSRVPTGGAGFLSA